jgi:hypothetical protein
VPIPLDLEEMGLPEGMTAKVTANEPCPAIESGPGRVVLTTVNHLNPSVVELTLAAHDGTRETVRPTAFHKFYSETHQQWLSAQDLQPRERLRGVTTPLQVVSSPWQDLRGGLMLGSEALWEKARGLIAEFEGTDEIRWSRRAGAEAVDKEIDRLATEQTDRRIAIWLEARHAGRRMTEVAKQYGYSDGSGVHRVIQRLEARAKKDRQLARQLKLLSGQVSRVRS